MVVSILSTCLNKSFHFDATRSLIFTRSWREEAGLTQRALGAKLKKPHSFVHKSEIGDRRIDPIELIAWCKACGKDPAFALHELY